MKRLFGTLLGLLVFGLSSAHAQFGTPFYNRPITNPLQTPFLNPYNPFSSYPNYGFYGNPGARPLGAFQGPYGTPAAGLASAPAVQNLGDPSVTGHPTRFFSYSQYFFNQGGTTATGTGTPTQGTSAAGLQGRSSVAIGSSPLRGRSSTSK